MLGPRRFPGWRRILLEYVAMTLVYIAVWVVTKNLILAIIALMAALFVGRATRDRGDAPKDKPKNRWP